MITEPSCWQRFKWTFCCCCYKQKKLTHARSAARLDQTVRDLAEPSISRSIKVEVKHHHIYKSTDMVTVSQFFNQDKEVLNANNDRDKAQERS